MRCLRCPALIKYTSGDAACRLQEETACMGSVAIG